MQTAENTLQRQHNLTIAAMQADSNSDLYDKQMMFNAAAGIGSLVSDILFPQGIRSNSQSQSSQSSSGFTLGGSGSIVEDAFPEFFQ
jgi:hypothetical protein